MADMKEVENIDEAERILNGEVEKKVEEKAEPQPDTSEPIVETVPTDQVDETQRRSWQSEADKYKREAETSKQEKEAIRIEAERLRMQAEMLQQQNKQILDFQRDTLSRFQTPKVEEEKEPEPDFVDADGFDPKRHTEWLKKRDNILLGKFKKTVIEEAKEELKRDTEKSKMVEQLQRIAQKHPDRYKNPITGEVMIDRIEADVREAASKFTPEALIDTLLARPIDTSVQKIAEATKKPSSVMMSTETASEPEPVDKNVTRTMKDLGMDAWELIPS
jgi:hypothetical protein